MISDWLSADGRVAIGKAELAGEVDNDDYLGCLVDIGDNDEEERELALLRDRAREWLVLRFVEIRTSGGPRGHPRFYPYSFSSGDIPTKPMFYDDYDSALIAAVLATEEGGR